MMKKIMLLSVCCTFFLGLFAQKKNTRTEIREYFNFKVGEIVYLFGNEVNVRAAPSTKAEILTKISANTKLKIVAIDESDSTKFLTVNGITAPWVKVNYDEKEMLEGFIWSPLIAQYRLEGAFYVDFLFGVTKKEDGQLFGKIRAVKEGFMLDEIEFKTIGDEAHHTYGRIHGNRGLAKSNIGNIIEAHFGYEACGYMNGYQAIVWEGEAEKFYYLGKDTGVGDGGIFFKGTSFIFPDEGEGKPEKILIKEEIGEFDDIGNGTINTKISVWDWSGTKLVKATNY